MRPALALIALGVALTPINQPVPVCQYEDSTACHWDAAHQGNGRGQSVTNP